MDIQQAPLAASVLSASVPSPLLPSILLSSTLPSSTSQLPLPIPHQGYDERSDHGGRVQQWSPLIGIVTALVGNILISLALNIQRYAHIRIEREWEQGKLQAHGTRQNSKPDLQTSYGTVGPNGRHARACPRRYRAQFVEDAEFRNNAPGTRDEHHESHDQLHRYFLSDRILPADGEQSHSRSRKSYLRSPWWWAGIILMTLGEAGNFMAYGFAPASIVSPLGVVALISNCVIAPFMLKEQFRQRDFWGVLIAIAGAVVVVLSAPSSEQKIGPNDIWRMITRWEFELYLGISAVLISIMMWASGKYGSQTILIDVGLVALFGGYTALSTKGVSSLLSFTLWHVITFPVTYLLVFILVASALMQIRYINRALQRFDSTQVIPTQFVLFTLSVIIGSAVLYQDFNSVSAERAGKFVCGCVMTFLGVYLITSGRVHVDDGSSAITEDDEEAIGLLRPEGYMNRVDLSPSRQQPQANNPKQISFEPEDPLQSPAGSLLSQGMEDVDEDSLTPEDVQSPVSPSDSLHANSLSDPVSESASPVHSQSLTANPWSDTHTPFLQETASEPEIHRLSTPTGLLDQDAPPLTVILRFPAAPGISGPPFENGASSDTHQSPTGADTAGNSRLRNFSVPHTPPASTQRSSLSMRFSPGPLLPTISGGGFSAVVADSIRRSETSSLKERKYGRKDSRRQPFNNAEVVDLLFREPALEAQEPGSSCLGAAGMDHPCFNSARVAPTRHNLSVDVPRTSTINGTVAPTIASPAAHSGNGDKNTEGTSAPVNRLRSVSDSLHGSLTWLGTSLRRSRKDSQSVLGASDNGEAVGSNVSGREGDGGADSQLS